MVISLTGGGGKTTTMNYIASYMAKNKLRVIITTTTHIKKPKDYLEIQRADELTGFEWKDKPLVIGKDEGEKLASIELKEVENLQKFAEIVLIEADGAKKLPIKVPKDGEPVIPLSTDICIICMGVDAVGKSIGEACFRKETAKKLFGWNDAHIITCEDAARILTEKSAGLKGVNGRKTVFLINKADNDNEMEKAMEIGKYINRFCEYMKITNYKVSITSYKSGREFADFAFLEDWRQNSRRDRLYD